VRRWWRRQQLAAGGFVLDTDSAGLNANAVVIILAVAKRCDCIYLPYVGYNARLDRCTRKRRRIVGDAPFLSRIGEQGNDAGARCVVSHECDRESRDNDRCTRCVAGREQVYRIRVSRHRR
jgi:hypothetical protein